MGNTQAIRRAPVSFSQRRLWLLDRLLSARAAYNVATPLRLLGPLDVDALRRAFNELIRRHEALRTHFVIEDGEPVQEIVSELALAFETEDISALSADAREHEARRRAVDDAQLEFDLARGPLLRLRLLRLARDEHWLLLTMHHIARDAWSASVLAREVSALYSAFRAGEASPLSDLAVQYADFAQWQRERLQGDAPARLSAYWREALADTPALELASDRPRPALPTHRGGSVSFAIDARVTTALKSLARGENATLFMTVLAAFQILLCRYSGQEDVVVGAPMAGRPRAEYESLVGIFVNLLPLRGDLSGDPTFRAYLHRTRERALAAYAHSDLPFEVLVEQIAPKRELSRNPLFDVALTYRNVAPAEWNLSGLEVQRLRDVVPVNAIYDLTLGAGEAGGCLRGTFDYARDLFDAGTIERMARQWETLLADIAAGPDRPVSRLRLMEDGARARLLAGGNNLRADSAPRDSVAALFAEQARQTPDSIAIIDGERSLRYAELEQRATALARRLSDLGVRRGARVGTCLDRSIEEMVAFLAVLKLGCAYLPVDPRHPPERLAFVLRDADAAAVVTTRSAERALGRARAASARPVIVLDAAEAGQSEAQGAPDCVVGADDPAYALYTSGSTGAPKGVVVPHRAIIRLVRDTDYLQLGATDVVAHLSNAAFDAATFEIWGALLNGARIAVVPREAVLVPSELASVLDRHGVTALFLTTALFNLVARDAPQAFAGRTVLFGGEAVDPRSVAVALSAGKPARLLHVYGPTETTTFATWHEVHAVDADATTVPIGRPIANTEVYLLDGNREPVPPGVPGEIHIGGPGLALGYLGRTDLSAQRWVPHPFSRDQAARLYRTGDRARYDDAGAIEFLGRLDRQVKIRGHRVEPDEIEIALRALPQVRDAIIVVRADTAETRRLDAYVVLAPGSAAEPAELMRDLRRTLPGYMIPAAIVMLPAFPLTSSGKIDRQALPEPEAIVARRAGAHVAPRDVLENLIAPIWEELLGVRDIGVHDSFFDLGGHSLLAAQMMDEVERASGVAIPLSTLFTGSTIADLARALRRRINSTSPVVALRTEGARPPLFFLHGDFTGGGFYCRRLALELGGDQPFYAVHPHGLDGMEIPPSIDAMAAELADAIRKAKAHGPYIIGGHCNGALVAVEVARRLVAQEQEVPLVMVLDAKAPWRSTPVAPTLSLGEPPPRSRRRGIEAEPRTLPEDADPFDRYRHAIASYAPQRIPVRIALLRSEGTADLRPDFGWSMIGERVETHAIPGNHHSSITRHVVETAARMRACIDSVCGVTS
jgi:amino acid adenylation domain-containing protein